MADNTHNEHTVRIGGEDLVERREYVITDDDIAEGDMRALFESPLMQEFVEFIGAGLPDQYVRSHPELAKPGSLGKIRDAIAEVPDQALKGFLRFRADAIEKCLD